MNFKMSPKQVDALLYELCTVLGFCPSPDVHQSFMSSPPGDIDEFTDAIIRADGLDPHSDIPLQLRRDVRAKVAKHFSKVEDEHFKQTV